MTQRGPIYTRIGPREQPRSLLTWTNGVQQGLQPTPFIPRQWDWPNPVRAVFKKDLYSWVEGIPQEALNLTIPSGERQRDWPNPTLRKGSNDLLNWLVQPQIAPAAVVSLPFNQTNWPNPAARPQNPDLRFWVDGLPQTALSLTLPPRQTEWPNPVTGKAIDRTWVYSQQIPAAVVVAMPVQVTDWPNPVARVRASLSWSFSIQQGLQPTPFIARQSEWPNPAPARRNLELLSWSFKLQLQPAVASPFNRSDWPNPSPKPPNLALRSWTQSLSVPAVGRPVRQLDWPNPDKYRRSLALLVDYAPNTTARGIPAAPGTVLLETIPYLIGAEEYAARQMLSSIYMVVVVVGSGGTVTAQDVEAFTLAPRGTTVTITMGGTTHFSRGSHGPPPYNLH